MQFRKILPLVSYEAFIKKVKALEGFTSSMGKRYHVEGLRDDKLYVERLDAKRDIDWTIDLKALYRAYLELESFKTEDFRPYIPYTHSPGRGILLAIGLIE